MMPRRSVGKKGFSLVELMIAMVVLAIGIMATMAMQMTALAGYSAAREGTGAIEVARTMEQTLKVDGMSWTSGTPLSGTWLPQLDAATDWVLATPAGPVSQRWGDDDDRGPRRFCVFVDGGMMPADPNDPDPNAPPQEYFRAAIAVVYPASNGSFPGRDAANPFGLCNGINTANIDPTDMMPLEMQGLRVTFLSTSIRPRG